LFGCGVGGFGFTCLLVLLVVGVGYVGVSWLWGRNKFGVYHLSYRLRNLISEDLNPKVVFKRVSLCFSKKNRNKYWPDAFDCKSLKCKKDNLTSRKGTQNE
jgi:hypothetical protein